MLSQFALFAPPKKGGTLCVRYFMPWQTHLVWRLLLPSVLQLISGGSVTDDLVDRLNGNGSDVLLSIPWDL